MSFMLTTPQMRARKKDVTRRCAWWNLRPGDKVMAVEKGQGLKAGEKVPRIHPILIVATRRERLDLMIEDDRYGIEECRREGFPDMHPMVFITMFCASHPKCRSNTIVNRIEFKHL